MTAFAHAGRYGPEAVIDSNGRAQKNVTVTVRTPIGDLATLYSDATMGTTVTNPIRTDAVTGDLHFFAVPGDYTVAIGGDSFTVTVPADPRDLQAEADARAAETTRATAAEAANAAAITAETSRATTAEAGKVAKAGDTMTGPLVLSGAPTLDLHAATKAYVDAETTRATGAEATLTTNVAANTSAISTETSRAQAAEAAISAGLQFKAARVVATSNVASRSGLQTIDGVTLLANDIVLLVGQSSGSQNGLWKAASGAWTRPSNYATGSDATAVSVWVEDGTANKSSVWVVAGSPPNVVDTNVVTYQQASGLGEVVAGTGIVKTGNTLSTDPAVVARALVRTAVKTGNYAANPGELVPCDTTTAAFTVTLPNAPAVGTRVAVKIVTLGAGHFVTIACAGSDVFNKTGGATTGTLQLLGHAMNLQYDTGGIWTVVADDVPLTQLNGSYVQPAFKTSTAAVAKAPYYNIQDFSGAFLDGVTDDTPAWLAAIAQFLIAPLEIRWPAAVRTRVTAQLPYLTTGDVSGLRIVGGDMLSSIMLFDFANGAPLFLLDGVQVTAHQYKFQHHAALRDFTIMPGSSVGSGVRNQGAAVSHTAQMHFDINLNIQGIHGDGVISPLRTDIDPSSNADGYASLYVDLCESVIENCQGRGFAGDAGIGCSSVRYSRARIGKNRQGGVVIAGHNHDLGNTASIYSNGYDADVYSDLTIAGDGVTVTATVDALGNPAQPFVVGDAGKHVTGSSVGLIPAGATISAQVSSSSFTLSAAATPSATTTIAAGSDGAVLPQATIALADASSASANGGTVVIQTTAGRQLVKYTGVSGTNLTGCSGGAGTMALGNAVTWPSGQLYVQRTGLKYPGVHVKKVNGNVTGLKVGTCELDGNKVANLKLEGCATGTLFEVRDIHHESTFNDGEMSPPIGILFANAISGSKNTSIAIERTYHRSEDLGHGTTVTLYDLGNNANNTDIDIRNYNVPSTDNVPAGQITEIANKNNASRVRATKGSTMKSSNGELPQAIYRWSAGRADTGCSTQGTNVVLDPTAKASDIGMSISSSDAGIPANATISSVTVGVGYTISAVATTTAGSLTFTIGAALPSTTDTIVMFNNQSVDLDLIYDGTSGLISPQYRGVYRIAGQVTLVSPTVNRRVRVYLIQFTAPNTKTIVQQQTWYASGNGNEQVPFDFEALLTNGNTYAIAFDNNSGNPHAVQLNTQESNLSIRGV